MPSSVTASRAFLLTKERKLIMYLIEKVGQYGHGVFWIGEDLIEGVHELLLKCQGDDDDYHKWLLQEFMSNCDPSVDADHKILVSIAKKVEGRKPDWITYRELSTEIGDVTVLEGFDVILDNFNGEAGYIK
jgi:hypothetical protein